jgi:hypothetical protein
MVFTPPRWLRIACASAPLLAWCAPARAEEACGSSGSWVALSTTTLNESLLAIRTELRAGLVPNAIDVCVGVDEGASERRPLARVAVEAVDAAAAHYRLEVTDSVTNKHISRDVRLDALPADGRNFALAVASEELLRASWAELALQRARPPEPPPRVEQPPPPSPPRAVSAPPTARTYGGVGLRVAFEHFTGGQSHLGADLFVHLPLHRRLAFQASLGARRGLSVTAPHGTIASSAVGADAGFAVSLLRRSAFETAAFVAARALLLTFTPRATTDAEAVSERGVAATARGGLSFALGAPGRLRSYTALGAGAPLRSFSASDSGEVVTGTSGIELFGATGLAWELP